MSNPYHELQTLTVDAIKKACVDMDAKHGDARLFGFALCTDDDVMTLFSAACTRAWVSEREYKYAGIGYFYNEWNQPSGDVHFNSISKRVAEMYAAEEDVAYVDARDRRFEVFVLALEECRNAGLFDEDTLLCCGSTDPSGHMQRLAKNAVIRLNSKLIAEQYAAALGYEHLQ